MDDTPCLNCGGPHPQRPFCDKCAIDSIATNDLIGELVRRCDSIVLAVDLKANKDNTIEHTYRGDIHKQRGLVELLREKIIEAKEQHND